MAIAIIRTLILYLAIIFSMRVMGKRQLGELEPAELVVAVLISDLAAHPLQDIGTPLLYGLIPVLTLLCCEVLMSAGVVKSIRFRSFICGKPSMIIENGQINQAEMRKNRYTLDELAEQLRKKDVIDIATVKFAILETDGTLSVIPYPAEAPLTPKHMNVQPDDIAYPIIVISDGKVLKSNLQLLGYNDKWLKNQLAGREIKSPEDVFLMSADSSGKVFWTAREARG